VDDELAGMEEGELILVEEKVGGRKKRSMKLEVGLSFHDVPTLLVHFRSRLRFSGFAL
jgi:hypothetical protein